MKILHIIAFVIGSMSLIILLLRGAIGVVTSIITGSIGGKEVARSASIINAIEYAFLLYAVIHLFSR